MVGWIGLGLDEVVLVVVFEGCCVEGEGILLCFDLVVFDLFVL